MDAPDDYHWGEYTCKISNFTGKKAEKIYSEAFTIYGCRWRILVFPQGNNSDHLSLYLDVADSATLPRGWSRYAEFRLSVIDQIDDAYSVRKGTRHNFTARDFDWGFKNFIPLTELHDRIGGYLLNDTLVIKAQVCVLTVTPVNIQPARQTDKFDSYFAGLEEFVNAAETNVVREGSIPCHHDGALTAEIPGLEVEKECLSGLVKLNMKERLSEALSTLSSAGTGLSSEQQIAIVRFEANFNKNTSDLLAFELDNAVLELHKLQRDQRFSAMKKSHETQISYKQLMDYLALEEEQLKIRMEEVKFMRDKLLLDWEILLVKAEEARSGYKDEQKKVAEAEEKKRIAEERLSRSTTALSNLKARFC
ncbi:hypothetical protein BT93_K1022 [Corymbia citriodora subsp. variegata]|nr:hypothetical protein BT93_K1022 [Corymbia citriodora subsp. variegata]